MNEFLNQEYIKESFRSHLNNNPALLDIQVSQYIIRVTSGFVKISNDTVFTNQASILISVYSTTIIDGARVLDSTSSTSFINVVESTVTIEHFDVRNITTDTRSRFINILS